MGCCGSYECLREMSTRCGSCIDRFFPNWMVDFVDNPCGCAERRTPLLLVLSFELSVTFSVLVLGNAGGKISKTFYRMPSEQLCFELLALVFQVFLYLAYVKRNFRLGLIWIAYRPMHLLFLGYLLSNPWYWKPFWKPIEIGVRLLLIFPLTLVVWDYCKRLKERELSGFWENSDIDITVANRNIPVVIHDVDSSDSMDEESVMVMSTRSAGSLYHRMNREGDRISNMNRNRRAYARTRALNHPKVKKTRRQNELDYLERTRKIRYHNARKALRRRMRQRREELLGEAKANMTSVPTVHAGVKVKNVLPCPDIKGELTKQEQIEKLLEKHRQEIKLPHQDSVQILHRNPHPFVPSSCESRIIFSYFMTPRNESEENIEHKAPEN